MSKLLRRIKFFLGCIARDGRTMNFHDITMIDPQDITEVELNLYAGVITLRLSNGIGHKLIFDQYSRNMVLESEPTTVYRFKIEKIQGKY